VTFEATSEVVAAQVRIQEEGSDFQPVSIVSPAFHVRRLVCMSSSPTSNPAGDRVVELPSSFDHAALELLELNSVDCLVRLPATSHFAFERVVVNYGSIEVPASSTMNVTTMILADDIRGAGRVTVARLFVPGSHLDIYEATLVVTGTASISTTSWDQRSGARVVFQGQLEWRPTSSSSLLLVDGSQFLLDVNATAVFDGVISTSRSGTGASRFLNLGSMSVLQTTYMQADFENRG
jgi:hypothetical protein